MKKTISMIALLLCMILALTSCDLASMLPEFIGGTTEEVATTAPAESTEAPTEATTEKEPATQAPTEETTTGGNNEPEPPKTRTVKIYNAGQLLSILENSKSADYADTSKNIIYQLQTDIDFNEGWDATVTVDGNKITPPEAPENTWAGFEKFYGTLDGNGKTIKGIYMFKDLNSNGTMGFIGELCGGTIKNLTIENSYFSASVADDATNVAVGGLIGRVSEASTVENVTVKGNVYVAGPETVAAALTVAVKADNALTETNFTAEGEAYVISDDPSVIKVANAEELFAALETYGDFAGLTLKLTADIDLNPGWSAEVVIGETIQFPSAPAVVWPIISTFKGVFDGNGKTISGVYSTLTHSSTSTAGFGGMIKKLDGGTIKNLVIKNSFLHATSTASWGTAGVGIGGIVGEITNNAKISTLYSDMEVWYQYSQHCQLGGIIGTATGNYQAENVVFAGRLGHTDNNLTVNYTHSDGGKKIQFGQLTGNQNWKGGSSATNILMIGTYHNTVYSTRADVTGPSNSNDSTLPKTNCLLGKKDASFLTENTAYADAGWVYDADLGYVLPQFVLDMLK